MDQENVVYIQNGISSSLQKKGKTLIWDMDESKGHYMMWNKPDTGKTNITWSHLCRKY